MLVETHAHLDFPEYDNDRDDVIRRANACGVGIIINVSSSLKGCLASVELSKSYDCIYAACGIHPHDAKELTDDTVRQIKNLILSSKKVVAIGEVGLDFFRDISPRDIQQEAFIKFVRLSKELNLPLILHCREAEYGQNEAARFIIDTLKENLTAPFKAAMHCFSGDKEFLKEWLDAGLYVSFTCNVTFKKADRLRETLRAAPIDRLMLETDAPFLSPQAKRGERNEPAYLTYLVDAVAENLNIAKDDVERITTENAKAFFGIS